MRQKFCWNFDIRIEQAKKKKKKFWTHSLDFQTRKRRIWRTFVQICKKRKSIHCVWLVLNGKCILSNSLGITLISACQCFCKCAYKYLKMFFLARAFCTISTAITCHQQSLDSLRVRPTDRCCYGLPHCEIKNNLTFAFNSFYAFRLVCCNKVCWWLLLHSVV